MKRAPAEHCCAAGRTQPSLLRRLAAGAGRLSRRAECAAGPYSSASESVVRNASGQDLVATPSNM